MTLDPSANSLTIENASVLNINAGAIFDVQGDGNVLVASGGGVINNFSTFKKSGGVSGTRFDCVVNNAGTISSESGAGGTLILNNGGTMTAGTLTTSIATDFIDVAGGVFTINGGAITGPGLTRTTTGGEIDIALSTIIAANNFAMAGGTLGGSGELQITTFKWSGGTMKGSGTTTLLGTASFDGSNSVMTLTNRTLKTNAATVNYSPANPLDIKTGGVFNNIGGTIDLQNNANINSSDASGQMINAAGQTIKKSNVGTTIFNVPINNSGTLQSTISGGSFKLAANATQSITGAIDLSPGTSSSIEFANGVFNMSGTTVTGPGSVNLFNGSLNINSAESFPVFNLGGTGITTVASPNQLTVTSQLSFDGGTLTGNGATDVTATGSGLQIGGSFPSLLTGGHTLHAHTNTAYSASNTKFLTIGPSSTFINEAGFTFSAGGTGPIGGSSGTFSNLGAFSNSGGPTNINAIFNHSGTLTNGGTLVLNGGGTSTGAITNTGFLEFGGGTYLLNAGTSTTIGSVFKVFGSATVNSSVNLNLTNFGLLGNGTFTGTGNLSIVGGLWSGGTLATTGTASTTNNGTFTIDGANAAMTLDKRTLINAGTLLYTPTLNALSLINGASITNNVSSVIDIKSDQPISGGSISNNGTFQKTVGSGSPSLPAMSNAGSVAANTGTMVFPSFTQSAGNTTLSGGNLSVTPGTFQLNGGNLAGTGTISGSVTNAGGAVNPGNGGATGTLTITNGYSQSAGSMNIRLGGTTAGTQYDQVVVGGGTANLSGGAFNATLFNAFLPANGNTFDVFTFPSKSGDFATKNLPSNWVPSASFNAAYLPAGTPTKLQLQAVTPIALADVAVTKSGPAFVSSGGSITYNITVKNVGGAAATSVVLNDVLPSRLTNVSIGGACSAFPCNIGTLNAGQGVNVVVTADVTPAGPGTITNTASITATGDSNPSNNSSSVTTDIGCSSFVPLLSFPADGSTNAPTSGTLQWSSTGAASYKVYLDVAGVGCTTKTAAGTTSATQLAYSNFKVNTDYEWRVEGITPGCPNVVSTCGHFKTASNNGCAAAPTLIAPANNATVASPVHFQWSAVTGASQYELFISNNGGASISVGTTSSTSVDLNVVDGPGTWFVVATVPNCGTLQSATQSFITCNLSTAPIVSVVAEALSGQSYAALWDAVVGSTKYEIDEATNAAFTDATTQTITTTPASNTSVSVGFTKTAQQLAQPFFYRVRAFSACGQAFGPYSTVVRIVIAPLPSKNQTNPNVNVPAGSTQLVVQQIFIPGQGGTFNYTARADEPWLLITPPSGPFPPEGVTLTLTTDPSNLPNGTFTGTIIVTLAPLATGLAHTDVTPVVSVPVSISLVTPVTPVSNNTPPAGALIIPSVGHLDGILSHWQSDIRVTNAGFAKQTYSLTFTPEDSSKGTKTTQIVIDSGATTALDDIVRNWYGVGQLGESAIGVLEIHPVTTSTGPKPEQTVGQSLTTVASSRTYNVATNGTLGQYVPAIPFASFIGKAAPNSLAQVLSLQQVAQSAAFRTNFGLVEAAGKPASVVLSVFDDSGKNLQDIPIELKAFEQRQLNQMLATYGITNLSDGRVEAKVVAGDGRITAYASVVDNGTQDPLLVSGVALNQVLSSKFVLPGVAALNNGFANWRTDMRIFNAGATAQDATLTMYPFIGTGSPIVRSASINPGEVKVLDDVVQSLFGQSNLGGAVHVTTTNDSQLIVTGRTYDKTSAGTFGQFVPAVTPNDAIGLGGRALQILQVEDSPRFRTNVAIAEVTGKPAKVEVSVVLPQSRVTPILQLDLAGNEYRQDAIIQEMGLGNVYNARITVRVISGEGKITASGSVIDMTTQDPTYVPAQ
jgi:uncharacterized repeat protein (TIGR01451 family)